MRAGEKASPVLSACLENELRLLQEVSQLSARAVRDFIGYEGYLPEWKNRPADFVSDYARFLRNIAASGYGVFLKHRMFYAAGGEIVPVAYPDPVRLADLKGYDRERKAVVENTRALLAGKPRPTRFCTGTQARANPPPSRRW